LLAVNTRLRLIQTPHFRQGHSSSKKMGPTAEPGLRAAEGGMHPVVATTLAGGRQPSPNEKLWPNQARGEQGPVTIKGHVDDEWPSTCLYALAVGATRRWPAPRWYVEGRVKADRTARFLPAVRGEGVVPRSSRTPNGRPFHPGNTSPSARAGRRSAPGARHQPLRTGEIVNERPEDDVFGSFRNHYQDLQPDELQVTQIPSLSGAQVKRAQTSPTS